MRAVLYARYSSDLQRDDSIEDQIRLCRQRIEQEGWQYLHAYTDRALSGASALRPAYQSLLEDARRGGQFDVVVAEALDRLSRDQEDVAGLLSDCASPVCACSRWPRARSPSCTWDSRAR
jgi:site-specific DNA recombinase